MPQYFHSQSFLRVQSRINFEVLTSKPCYSMNIGQNHSNAVKGCFQKLPLFRRSSLVGFDLCRRSQTCWNISKFSRFLNKSLYCQHIAPELKKMPFSWAILFPSLFAFTFILFPHRSFDRFSYDLTIWLLWRTEIFHSNQWFPSLLYYNQYSNIPAYPESELNILRVVPAPPWSSWCMKYPNSSAFTHQPNTAGNSRK